MNTSRHHLAEVVGKRTLKVGNRQKLAREIAAYLLETDQTTSLESLLRDILVYRAEHGVVEATAVTAHDLTPEVTRHIRQIVKQEYPHSTATILDTKLEPQVVGGFRLEMPGEQLDATVTAKLNKFKRLTTQE